MRRFAGMFAFAIFDKRTGVGMSLGAPATILPCKDGYVWILTLETAQWNGLARVMGNPEWAQLEMFQDMFVRAQNADAMYPLIEQWTMQHSKWEIMEKCQAVNEVTRQQRFDICRRLLLIRKKNHVRYLTS